MRVFEPLDRRMLATIRLVDALGVPVRSPVTLRADGTGLFRKRPGEFVLLSATGLEAHSAAFEAPPATPAIGSQSLAIDLEPSSHSVMPRRATLALPRDPDPANSANGNSLFRPMEIVLLPSVTADPGGLAARLHVTVRRSGDNHLVEGALVRVRPAGGQPQAVALTNAAGEALVLVPAIPLANPGTGATVVADIEAQLDAIVDPGLARIHDPSDLAAAREAEAERASGFIDPEDLESRLSGSATTAQTVRIAPSQFRTASVQWSPP